MKKIVRMDYGRVMLNTSTDTPLFRCKSPEAGVHDCVELYAHDLKGSDRFMCYTFRPFETLTDSTGIDMITVLEAELFIEGHYGQLSQAEEETAIEMGLLNTVDTH